MDDDPRTLIADKLRATMGEIGYADLRSHLERDHVFVIGPELSLVDCGVAIAMDAVSVVGVWIEAGTIRKPSRAERAAWPEDGERRWNAVIVQPFVLVQDPAVH